MAFPVKCLKWVFTPYLLLTLDDIQAIWHGLQFQTLPSPPMCLSGLRCFHFPTITLSVTTVWYLLQFSKLTLLCQALNFQLIFPLSEIPILSSLPGELFLILQARIQNTVSSVDSVSAVPSSLLLHFPCAQSSLYKL